MAPDDPGGLTAANQGLSVTQLAVNERPLLSDEIFLAPAAEVLSGENVALQISEEHSLITNKEKFDTLEVSTENSCFQCLLLEYQIFLYSLLSYALQKSARLHFLHLKPLQREQERFHLTIKAAHLLLVA